MIKTGALRTSHIPRIRITEEEEKQILARRKELKMSITEYIRYCVNKDLKSND